jgi:hypothetical protein
MEATTTIRAGEREAGENLPAIAPASARLEDDPITRSLKLLDAIRAAIKAGDVDTIRHSGDALKGCITSVLAKEALIAASVLEKAEDEDDLGRAKDACQRLRTAITCLNSR